MSYLPLFEKLDPSTCILTVNERLCATLHAAYLRDTNEGRYSLKPNIFSLSDFLSTQYEALTLTEPMPTIAAASHIHLLLTRVIGDCEDELGLVSPSETAKTIAKAYRHLTLWDETLDSANDGSPESTRFIAWVTALEDALSTHDAMMAEKIPYALMTRAPLYQQFVLVGFDDIPPLYQQLFDSWEEQGATVERHDSTPVATQQRIACKDPADEMLSAALLSKQLATSGDNVLVVVPDLQANRQQLMTRFIDVFEPECARSLEHLPRTFALTGGDPLSGVPLIHDAFTMLARYKSTSSHALADWAMTFQHYLHEQAWLGERELTSDEHQAVQRFYGLLDEFARLQVITGSLDISSALDLLTQMAKDTLYQAESEKGVNVRVCGLLEAAAYQADTIIMMGMNATQFPSRAKPNPYLPISLQRDKAMPHADASREMQFAQDVLRQCSANAKTMIGLYAMMEDDLHLEPSQLIADWSEGGFSHEFCSEIQNSFRHKPDLNHVDDFRAPPVREAERSALKNGVGIFKRMAACPFQSFVKDRLKLNAVDEASKPFNPLMRGSLLHLVLERFWQQISTQAELQALSEDAKNDLMNTVIHQAMADIAKDDPAALPVHLRDIEAERLRGLLSEWLDLESTRAPFTVLEHEKTIFGSIGGIPIHGRVDRIDRVGEVELLIDYKSGLLKKEVWFDERLAEPQLPIYALLTTASAIAFGRVISHAVAIDGVGELEEEGIDEKAFGPLKTFWQNSLTKLAEQFLAGNAEVDPQFGEQTCKWCEFEQICRKEVV